MTTNLISERVYPNSTQILVHTLDQFVKSIAPTAEFVIAGGAVLSSYTFNKLDASDIDIFPKTQEDFNAIVLGMGKQEIMHSIHPNCMMFQVPFDRRPIKDGISIPFTKAMLQDANAVHRIDGEYKIRRNVPAQLIRQMMYDDIESLLNTFDFSICQIAYSNGRYLMTPEAHQDIAAKRLVLSDTFNKDKFKTNRLLKYMKRGYEITPELFKTIYLENRVTLHAGEMTTEADLNDYDF